MVRIHDGLLLDRMRGLKLKQAHGQNCGTSTGTVTAAKKHDPLSVPALPSRCASLEEQRTGQRPVSQRPLPSPAFGGAIMAAPKQAVQRQHLQAPGAHVALVLLALAPLVVYLPVAANIVLTASLTVFVGCWRSIKPEPPAEAMSKKVRGCRHLPPARPTTRPPAAVGRPACSVFLVLPSVAPLLQGLLAGRDRRYSSRHTVHRAASLQDAMKFPIIGSCVLFSLFLAFKFLPKHLVNAVLSGACDDALLWHESGCGGGQRRWRRAAVSVGAVARADADRLAFEDMPFAVRHAHTQGSTVPSSGVLNYPPASLIRPLTPLPPPITPAPLPSFCCMQPTLCCWACWRSWPRWSRFWRR